MEDSTNLKARKKYKRLLLVIIGVVSLIGFPVFVITSKSVHYFAEYKDNYDGTETRICTKCNYSETRKKRLILNAFDDIVYPYIDCVKDYLIAGVDADVTQYTNGSKDQHKDYTISWYYNGNDIKSYILKYSIYEDFSYSTSIKLDKNTNEYTFSNLYKDQTYYVKLIAIAKDGNSVSEDSFRTTSLGPRVLNVGGLYGNVRDFIRH